jgi:signal-transduction protein with cAMP-binding, CBS, and nucleotidyltransferase domain
MNLFDIKNSSQIENFANLIKIATFMPQDVIIKQGDIGYNFFLILDGMVEVVAESRDFNFFDFT